MIHHDRARAAQRVNEKADKTQWRKAHERARERGGDGETEAREETERER